jgi:hypothetical protein
LRHDDEMRRTVRGWSVVMLRVLAAIILVFALSFALVMKTGESDLPPCSVTMEFSECGHQTDYRIPARLAIAFIGIVGATFLFRTARTFDAERGEKA